MALQVVRAIYRDKVLVFADPELAPQDGAEVIVTFLKRDRAEIESGKALIQDLRGRGKGEDLVEKLLASRREDLARDG